MAHIDIAKQCQHTAVIFHRKSHIAVLQQQKPDTYRNDPVWYAGLVPIKEIPTIRLVNSLARAENWLYLNWGLVNTFVIWTLLCSGDPGEIGEGEPDDLVSFSTPLRLNRKPNTPNAGSVSHYTNPQLQHCIDYSVAAIRGH